MAEHSDEGIHVRLRALEANLEGEVLAVQQHFDEQRRFITEQFAAQAAASRRELHAALQHLRDQIRADMVLLLDNQRDALRSELGAVRDELRTDIQRVERRVGGVEQRLDRVEQRLDGVEQRLGGVEQRLDGVEGRLGRVEQRLDGVEGRLGRVEWGLHTRER